MRRSSRAVMLALSLLLLWAGGPLQAEEEPLTNSDVISLAKAGLADDLIVAKIRQAPSVEFLLDTDSLVALKRDGVSDAAVKAMLDRVTPPAAAPAPTLPPEVAAMHARNPWSRSIRLLSTTGEQDLRPHTASFSSSGFAFVRLRFLNVQGLHSPLRTGDRNCALLVKAEIDPATSNEFRLTRFDVDDDDKVRSVKLGSGASDEFRSQRAAAPDEDFVVEFASEPAGSGTYKLTPRSPLAPGEYGVLTGGGGAVVFDFGVD